MPQSLDNHQGRGTAANAAAAVDASATSLDNEGSSSNGGSATTCLLPKTAKAKRDAKLVRRARATVMTVLLVSAVVVAALAYGTLKANEYDSFVNQFESAARQVIVTANKNAMNVFVSFETLAAFYPSTAKATNATLPFVTIDDFDGIAQRVRETSKASYVYFKPILHTMKEVEQWNNYSVHNRHWVAEGRKFANYEENEEESDEFPPFLYWLQGDQQVPVNSSGTSYAPVWQIAPLPAKLNDLVNFEPNMYPSSKASSAYVEATGKHSMTEPNPNIRKLYKFPDHVEGPISAYFEPVWSDVESVQKRTVKGILAGFLAWQYFFEGIFSGDKDEAGSVLIVIQSCATTSTFVITGTQAKFIDFGDHHDKKYRHMGVSYPFIAGDDKNSAIQVQCAHVVNVYPTAHMESLHRTETPIHYAVIIVSIFSFAAAVFVLYDYFVSSRQHHTEKQADKSNAIVQEMFPGDMAARLFESGGSSPDWTSTKSSKSKNAFGRLERDTIAELHPDATVLFADISGFTAWSSIRDPHQVFKLLESVFQAFDAIAKRYRIFKVETVGDCYVAVCGVPKPNEMHAVVMCSFARRAMIKFRWVCRSLEMLLGPDTGDLALRIGMHSGPVTAGVLRGDRARFQLFGDTVNTASRIESSGMRERVHLSEQTALQLTKHGKEDWIVKRDDAVEAKGKGKLVTYWLKLTGHQPSPGSVASVSDEGGPVPHRSGNLESLRQCSFEMPPSKSPDEDLQRNERLVQWNSELLLELLQRVVARRCSATRLTTASNSTAVSIDLTTLARTIGDGTMVVDEVAEIIDMPDFVACTNDSTDDVQLSDIVEEQLRAYVSQIAEMYNDNPFHNFEHASHVTMSIHKLLGRIVALTQLDPELGSNTDREAAFLHDHTCGITSDPLTQFAVVLSGLIHDLDHPGVSNGQLIKEDRKLATRYKEKSVAEQNSVDLAWSILMMPDYDELQAAIFSTETELRRFRSLLVNSIIATDIFDKDQSTLRKNRWNKAFYETTPQDDAHEVKSRKATIVIEHLIQASDVAHTMQHWHVYQKWNQRLFNEMMMAYRDGRSDKDPSEGWFGGELWFFDNYVIPLAKKLKECGVFGVSSDEYLDYALHNRDEWEAKGKDVVQQYQEEFEEKTHMRSKNATQVSL